MKKRSLSFMLLTAMMWLSGSAAWAIEQDAKGVYQIATAQDLADFAGLVNSGQKTINGAITADIDYTGEQTVIGSALNAKPFSGTLDGQGHTVTVDLTITEVRSALVSYLLNGVVRNLIVDGNITTEYERTGGIVSYNNGTVENCIFKGTINSIGSQFHGGIAASCNGGTTVRNCLFAGKIIGENTTRCGGIMGFCNGDGFTIQNCMNIGEIRTSADDTDSHVIAREPNRINMSNCCYLEGTNLVKDPKATAVTSEELANGKAAYLLSWGQNLGTDAMPSPFCKTTVYAVGRNHCDGSPYESVTYNNVGGEAQVDDHNLVDGVCSVCGQLPADSEGYLLLGGAKALKLFADKVNAGQKTLKAKLTADIDYTGEQTVIGSALRAKPFSGTLDGQGHTVTVDLTMIEVRSALVSYLDGGIVRNLVVDGNITTEYERTGGIVSYNNGTVENCIFKGTINSIGSQFHGGIAASCNGGTTVRNCLFAGKIIGENTTRCGGIMGYCNGDNFKISGCLNIGEIRTSADDTDSHVIAREPNRINMSNCCYLEGTSLVKDPNATAITNDDLASGKAAYLLTWGQNIGTDAMPSPLCKTTVYAVGRKHCDGSLYESVTYNNVGGEAQVDDHNLVDGVCDYCGQLPADAEGNLLLGGAKALKMFAEKVNAGQKTLKAKLTADIDYTGEQTVIGSAPKAKPFSGTFDGQGHTVTVDLTMTEVRSALVSYLDGGIVRNLIVDGNITTSYERTGGIVSYNNGLVENCIFKGTINSIGSQFHGGIAASCNGGTTVRNCLFAGKIIGENTTRCGGIMGYCNGDNFNIQNCMNIGEIRTKADDTDSHVIAREPNRIKISNCYYLDGTTLALDHDAKALASEDIANGKAASLLAWGQNLGTDAMPSPLCKTAVYAVGDAGYATMVATEDTKLNGNAKAYIGAKQGNYLTLTEVADVPAGQAVVLKGTYYNKVACTATADCSANELVAATSAVAADGSQYILGNVDDVVGFYKATGTIPAGKGYLVSAAGVKAFFFSDTATAIEGVTTDNGQQTTEIFNLAGQRVSKMQKGVNIVNGKKVMY